MPHYVVFVWVFTVCQSTRFGVSGPQRVIGPSITLFTYITGSIPILYFIEKCNMKEFLEKKKFLLTLKFPSLYNHCKVLSLYKHLITAMIWI